MKTRSPHRSTILVVDDQERNLQVVGEALEGQGYEIILAADSETALRRAAACPPDVILLDVLMPGMDGFEVCRRFKSEVSTADTPVIFLSAANEKDTIVRAIEAGGVDYVTKPFNKSELIARVAFHLELKQTRDKLRELVEQRDTFIGMLAHDLKNPFSGLWMCAQMLHENLDEFPPSARRSITNIHETAAEVLDYVDRFLKDKATAMADVHIELRPVDLCALLGKVRRRYLAAASRKQIDLIDETPETPVLVSADVHALEQVVENLVSNAIKFSPRERRVWLRASAKKSAGSLGVADEGKGITKEDKEKLFQPFVRLSARPTAGESSTGLGLSIVKRLTELMGGTVKCESAFGQQGTRFIINLSPPN